MDRLLDPERGIYAKILHLEGRITKAALGVASTVLVSLFVQLISAR